jgi:hypothetical protein
MLRWQSFWSTCRCRRRLPPDAPTAPRSSRLRSLRPRFLRRLLAGNVPARFWIQGLGFGVLVWGSGFEG